LSAFPTRILLATDGSPHAQLAAMKAVELAKSTGARLHVVAVGRTFSQAVFELYTETEEGVKPSDARLKRYWINRSGRSRRRAAPAPSPT
jgi:nucleotide-binding universal stress UspA family protein